MGQRDTFRGYGPEYGYEFLRDAIAENDYRARGLSVTDDEIFVSDGSKCDCGNILDIFGHQNRIAVMDPVYPVYVDTNVMAGHYICVHIYRIDGVHHRDAALMPEDRKSTRLNSSHQIISYAVFCL